MTFFLLGALTVLLLCFTSAYVLLRSAKRTTAVCRALTAFHAPETTVRHANTSKDVIVAGAVSSDGIAPQPYDSYVDAINAVQALGARKGEAQRMVKMAHDALLMRGEERNVGALIREAVAQKGRMQ
jgi:hypothetical protein